MYIFEGFEKYAKQIHIVLECLHIKNLSQRRKIQEEEMVFSENMQIIFWENEKIKDTYKWSILIEGYLNPK